MYMYGKVRAGTASYKNVDISSRIEGATPHQLVQIMYEELLKAMDAMAFATARGDYVQRGQRQSKALAILTGLETSLDFDKGGEVARTLGTFYYGLRGEILNAATGLDPEPFRAAANSLEDIAKAWNSLKAS